MRYCKSGGYQYLAKPKACEEAETAFQEAQNEFFPESGRGTSTLEAASLMTIYRYLRNRFLNSHPYVLLEGSEKYDVTPVFWETTLGFWRSILIVR
jgi:hypothetical protein